MIVTTHMTINLPFDMFVMTIAMMNLALLIYIRNYLIYIVRIISRFVGIIRIIRDVYCLSAILLLGFLW